MFNQKEMDLLRDLKSSEKLCIEKYGKFAQKASSQKLEDMLEGIKKQEESHLQALETVSGGVTPLPATLNGSATGDKLRAEVSNYSNDQAGYDGDKYLCADALATEKHVSSLYDVSIFEFKDPKVRQVLNHLQRQEQEHGELLYSYMEQNGMYN